MKTAREFHELFNAYVTAKQEIQNYNGLERAMYLLAGILRQSWVDAVYSRAHKAAESLGRKANGMDKDMIEFLVIREAVNRLPLMPRFILKDRWYEKYHRFQFQFQEP